MEQHPVPQNVTSFEFKIVGFLTLKQFAVIGTSGVLGFISFIAIENWTVKLITMFLIVGTGVLLTFGQVNNIPFSRWLMLFIQAVFSPTERIWIKSAVIPSYFTTVYAVAQPTNTLTFDNRQVLSSYLQTLPQGQRSALDIAEEQKLKSLGLNSYQSPTRSTTAQPLPQRPTISSPASQPPLPPLTPSTPNTPTVTLPLSTPPLKNNTIPTITISHLPTSLTPQTLSPQTNSSPKPEDKKQTITSNIPSPTIQSTEITNTPPATNPQPTPIPNVPPITNSQPITMPANQSVPVKVDGPTSVPKEEVIVMDPKIINQALGVSQQTNTQTTQPANTYQMLQRLEQQYVNELQSLEKEHSKQQEDLLSQLKTAQAQNEQLQKQLQTTNASTANQVSLTSELTNLKDQLTKLEANNKTLSAENEQLRRSQTESSQSITSAQAQANQITDLQATINQQQTLLQTKDQAINNLQTNLDALKHDKEVLAQANTTLEKEKQELKNQLDETAKTLEAVKKETRTEQEQKIEEVRKGFEAQLQRLQSELTQANNRLQEASSKELQLQKLTQENNALKNQNEALNTKVAQTNNDQQNYVTQITKLREELKAAETKNKVLQETIEKSMQSPAIPQTQKEFAPHLINLKQENEASRESGIKKQSFTSPININHAIPQNKAQTLPTQTEDLPTPQKKTDSDKKIITDYKTAQIPTISNLVNVVSGIVYDINNNIMQNAIIIVKDSDKSPVRALKSNRLGQFAISTPLPNGVYTIEVEDSKEESEFDIYQITLNGSVLPPIEIKAKEN